MNFLRTLALSLLLISGSLATKPEPNLHLVPCNAAEQGEKIIHLFKTWLLANGVDTSHIEAGVDALRNVMHEFTFKVLMLENTMIGYIMYCDDGDCRVIQMIQTEESLRGNGYGTITMQQFEEQSRNEGITRIELQSTGGSFPFYEKLGYERISPELGIQNGIAIDGRFFKNLQ